MRFYSIIAIIATITTAPLAHFSLLSLLLLRILFYCSCLYYLPGKLFGSFSGWIWTDRAISASTGISHPRASLLTGPRTASSCNLHASCRPHFRRHWSNCTYPVTFLLIRA
jgi:hypothetical protein